MQSDNGIEDGQKDKDARSLLTQLLDESKLYKKGKNFKELLDFVNQLRNFAPFNVSNHILCSQELFKVGISVTRQPRTDPDV